MARKMQALKPRDFQLITLAYRGLALVLRQSILRRIQRTLCVMALVALTACASPASGEVDGLYPKLVLDQITDSNLYNVLLKQDGERFMVQGNVGYASRSRGSQSRQRHVDILISKEGQIETIDGIKLLSRKRSMFFYRLNEAPGGSGFIRLLYSPFPHHRHEGNWPCRVIDEGSQTIESAPVKCTYTHS